jgi:UDP-N-acetyl-2-amino-2-deoxyglucuronate dehydrogenase
MKKLRMGIIGCGKVGHLHAQALQQIEKCELVAVQSRNPSRASVFAATYGVSHYSDIESMVVTEKLDAVIICTPHPEHRLPAVTALNAGAHVLVEKPLAVTLEDCDEMINTAEKTKKKLGVVSQRRFYPSSQRMKEAISAGKIGNPAIGTILMLGWRDEAYYKSDSWRGTWEKEGGGVLVNQAPHQLDLLQWFMNDEFDELYGIHKNVNHPYIEVEDTAMALVRFKKGGLANILVSNSQEPGLYAKVHIHGSRGASVGVQTDGGSMFIAGRTSTIPPPWNDVWSIPGEEQMLAQWKKEDEDFFKTIDPIIHFLLLQDQDFIHSILEGRDPLVTGRDGRKTVELFNAIYKSTRDNKTVRWPL